MGMFRSSPISNFDTIYVQDFGDDYHHPYFAEDNDGDIRKAAKGLMSQYTNIDDYEEAMEIYKLYMEDLVDRCGGKVNFDVYKESNSIPFFVPPKPRLKQTIANEMYKKYGLANYGFVKRANIAQQRKMAQGASTFLQKECPIDNIDENYTIDIDCREELDVDEIGVVNMAIMKEEGEGKEKPSTVSAMLEYFGDSGSTSGTPMIGRTKPGSIKAEKPDAYLVPSLAELASYDFDGEDFYIKQSELEEKKYKKHVVRTGTFSTNLTKEDKEKYAIISEMKDMGWDESILFGEIEDGSALSTIISEDKRLESRARRRKEDEAANALERMLDGELYNTFASKVSEMDDMWNSNIDREYDELY